MYEKNAAGWPGRLLKTAQQNLGERRLFIKASEALCNRGTVLTSPDGYGATKEATEPLIGIIVLCNDDDLPTADLGYHEAVLNAGGIPFILPSVDSLELLDRVIESFDGFVIQGAGTHDPLLCTSQNLGSIQSSSFEQNGLEQTLIEHIANRGKPLLSISRAAHTNSAELDSSEYEIIQSFVQATASTTRLQERFF